MYFQDNAIGCLLGAAFGDSLGATVEFMSEERIRESYGPQGIREPLGYPTLGPGTITDDTQQALAVARGLLHGKRRGGQTSQLVADVWAQLLQWYSLQEDSEFNRSPGSTSMMALGSRTPGTLEHPTNKSTSCGAVMRAHPIGLYYAADPLAAFDLGCRVGVLTHGGIDGYAPSGALAALISLTSRETELDLAVSAVLEILDEQTPKASRTRFLVRRALNADPTTMPAHLNCSAAGWSGDEALAIGILAARRAGNDLVEACSFAATHDGDSDSTASIAGAIVGSLYGVSCIPAAWQTKLEHAQELRQRGCELTRVADQRLLAALIN